jgi:hypothetical protein
VKKERVFVLGARVGEVPEAPPVEIPDHIKVSVGTKVAGKRRKMFRRLPYGYVPNLFPFCRDSNDAKTQRDALSRRLCRQLPPIDDSVLAEFTAYVARWCAQNLQPIPSGGLMSFENWLETTTYPAHRKEELRTLYQQSHGALPTRKVSARVYAFIKSESYLIGRVFKAARWICSRCDEAKCALGPCFKTIERAVYQHPAFVKHVPVPDRPALVSGLKEAGAKYVVSDYTSFEASFDPRLQRACEVQMYQYMLRNYPALSTYVATTIAGVNRIKTRAGVRVELQGRRMSGDMCTSLGNGFTNLMLMGFFCEKKGSTFRGYVEGDDGIFAVFGPLPTAADFATLGFDIKLAEITDPSLGGFCGVISCGSDLLRDPVKFFQTFGWTTSAVEGGDRVMMGLLRAKALSALYETPSCPIVSAVAARALALTAGAEPRWEWDGYRSPLPKGLIPRASGITAESRELFANLYGISPVDQVRLESEIESSDDLTCLDAVLIRDPNHSLVGNWFVCSG